MLHFSRRVHLSGGRSLKLSLQQSKLFFTENLLTEMSFCMLTLEQERSVYVCKSVSRLLLSILLPCFSFPSLLISSDGDVSTIPLNPACCLLPLSRCCGHKNRISGISFLLHLPVWWVFLISVRLYQSLSSHLISSPHSVLNYIASSQSNHTLR